MVVVVVVVLLLLLLFCHRLLLSERSELRASLDSSNALEVLLHLGLKNTNKAHAESHHCEDIRIQKVAGL